MRSSFGPAQAAVVSTALAATLVASLAAAPAAAATPGVDTPEALNGIAFIDIDLSGWASFGGFGRPGNSETFVHVGVGTVIIGFDYSNLSFTTENGSFLNEFTLSLNDSGGTVFMDWSPSTTNSPGTFGPGLGSWGGGSGASGPFGAGDSFAVADGVLWVTVYEGFDDPGSPPDTGLLRDALVSTGSLRVFLAPIPEPQTYGLMALGLLTIAGALRRRQQPH